MHLLSVLAVAALATPQDPTRWQLDGPRDLVWEVAADARLPHQDHIEMSGQRVAVVVDYGVAADRTLRLRRTVVWPMLRTIPNDTHASLIERFGAEVDAAIVVDAAPAGPERPRRVRIADGRLILESDLGDGLALTRTLFPSVDEAAVHEQLTLRNRGAAPHRVEVVARRTEQRTDRTEGVDGEYAIVTNARGVPAQDLAPGGELRFDLTIAAARAQDVPWDLPAATDPEGDRRRFAQAAFSKLRFECPEPELRAAFDLAKLRAIESVLRTRGGLMHAPGGTRYYAAIWANDTVEYAGPFYPLLGIALGNTATWNALRHFARFTNPDYEMLPSSIVAEGTDVWQGAGDRGDAAMIAYGATRFALALGDRAVAEELSPLIEWCLEYCRRHATSDGVVASDSDELEGRLPHGRTNLSTSMLTYGGLVGAARLARALGRPEAVAAEYDRRAAALRDASERCFGAEIDGFATYRYHDGCDVLRSWICVPLTMGVFDRRQGTLDALFSERLWTEDGLKSIATDATFWDRSTLYGLRGAFAAGDAERGLRFFRAYVHRRLLGEHVPYAVEAWPEGDQRHLSAESALLCRVVTEGMFGIEPLALDAFRLVPRLPAAWDRMALRDVHLCGATLDVEVARAGDAVTVTVRAGDAVLASARVDGDRPIDVRVPVALREEGVTPAPDPVDPTPAGARELTEREAALASQAWGTLRRGRSVGGRPLRIAGRTFARGIGTHAESEVPLFHDGSAATLHGLCGIDEEVAGPASVEFVVSSGETVLWRSGVMRRTDAARPFAVRLDGLRAVYLRATEAGDGNGYDHADWVELRVTPEESTPDRAAERRLSVVDFGASPGSGGDATDAVHRALAALRGAARATLVFPPGRYDFAPDRAVEHRWFVSNHDADEPKRVSIPVCGFEDLRIDAAGADLVFRDRVLPLAISDCAHVAVVGLSIDFARPHHSQATVRAADDAAVELEIAPEYPFDVADDRLWMLVGDRRLRVWSCMEFEWATGRIAWNTGDLPFRGTVERVDESRVRVRGLGRRPAVGNVLVLRHGGRPHPGIFVQRSRDVRFEGVVVHQAEGMGWLVQRSADVTIEGGGVRIRDGSDRVFTTSADATHFSNCSGTVRVAGARFEGMMDDAINVHGTYLQVQGIEDGGAVRARFVHGQSTGFEFAGAGDRVRFVRAATLLPYAEARVERVRRLSDAEVLLVFAGGPPAAVTAGDGLENLEAMPEVVFSGNTVRNNRARGALLSSGRPTLVEDNLFDHSSGSAILLAGDCNGWFESGACDGVVIRRNRFVNCLTSLYQFTAAVISIHPEIPDLRAQEHPYHADVRIEDNDFVAFDAPILFARSVDGLTFRGNRIEGSDEYPPFHPVRQRFVVEGCRDAEVRDR